MKLGNGKALTSQSKIISSPDKTTLSCGPVITSGGMPTTSKVPLKEEK